MSERLVDISANGILQEKIKEIKGGLVYSEFLEPMIVNQNFKKEIT